jgi:acid phosphatase type 7
MTKQGKYQMAKQSPQGKRKQPDSGTSSESAPTKEAPEPKHRTPKILKAPPPRPGIGKHGVKFHASRRSRGFTTDPPGFTTEKDPRGKADNKWFDLPAATGQSPYRLKLESILSAEAMNKITANNRLVFHSVGDTGGVNTTTYQQQVATYMELDFSDGNDAGGDDPSFFYHLGDVVYYDGEITNYYWEFYEPYLHYPAPIFAIPGNHDGDVDPNDQFHSPSDSLKGFVRNFCAQAAVHLPEADDAPRPAMTQPNVYWTLLTPLATFIGLYTNVPEGGEVGTNQVEWFKNELQAAPTDLPIILSLHHPVLSAYGHQPGSPKMKSLVEDAVGATGRMPALILTGHVHDYQRFTADINGKKVPTIVAGAGGYNQRLHALSRRQFDPTKCPYTFAGGPDVLESFNDWQHGYLKIEVTEQQIDVKYIAVDDPKAGDTPPQTPAKPYDGFTYDLESGAIVTTVQPPSSVP